MKSLTKTSGVSVLLLALAGCADFKLPELPALPSLPTAAPVTDSTDKICKEWEANKIRAKNMYAGKMLSAVSKLEHIREGHDNTSFKPIYELSFAVKRGKYYNDPDDVSIVAGVLKSISSSRAIESISVGDTLRISGTIDSVMLGNGCTIYLTRASFSK